jgi:hypothetical protein
VPVDAGSLARLGGAIAGCGGGSSSGMTSVAACPAVADGSVQAASATGAVD